jgi:hypothetical protein
MRSGNPSPFTPPRVTRRPRAASRPSSTRVCEEVVPELEAPELRRRRAGAHRRRLRVRARRIVTARQDAHGPEPHETRPQPDPDASHDHVRWHGRVRSGEHGFFFKPDAPGAGGGLFGLPVLNESANGGWGGGISNVGFWRVTEAGGLEKRGIVSSSNAAGVCETSCVDWYGNTRPVFIRDRAFALMGSELAEITLAPSAARLGQAAILGN